ncbi:MAG: hypothetical protein HY890_00690 [Deltaproteobacteria bacterium]|nr:hypothetical protein [Deltaproteobacteria bacterium]
MRFIRHNDLIINEKFLGLLKANGLDGLDVLMDYGGGNTVIVKRKAARSVVRFDLGGAEGKKTFYLKRHCRSVEARVKRLFSLSLAADGRNEWEKIILLTELGFPTMVPVAYGEKAGGGSFTLTEELYGCVRVEDYIPALSSRLKGFDGVIEKRRLIKRLALLAREFHAKGFNHQDFYLCHFFIRPATGEFFIVDVQRVQKRDGLPALRWDAKDRWVVKDLAQFAFSAKNTENFSSADLVRFGHAYLGKDRFGREDKKRIRGILAKSRRIARHDAKLLERMKREGR